MRHLRVVAVAAALFLSGVLSGPLLTHADPVDPLATGVVAMAVSSEYGRVALDQDGHAWRVSDTGWSPASVLPLPMPVSEVKLWEVSALVTNDNVAWVYDPTGGWRSVGQWPGGATEAASTTWGALKAGFK